jgi:putative DNA primase/helicase
MCLVSINASIVYEVHRPPEGPRGVAMSVIRLDGTPFGELPDVDERREMPDSAYADDERERGLNHPPKGAAPNGELKVTRLSDIAPKPIRPLWPGFLYLGKITVLAGVPGDGKSLLALDIAARITAGKAWPVGKGKFAIAKVVLLTAEDDPADTIRPRLDMAGADTELLRLIEGSYHTHPLSLVRTLDLVSLINDLPNIERLLIELGAHLLVIDPLTSFADSDTNKTADMRRLLDGLAGVAARTGVAILVITHMNKRSDARKAMQMIAGSHVIVAAVRAVMVTARDPNDKQLRLILPIKLNIGPDDVGFAWRAVPKSHAVCGDIPTAEWEPETVLDLNADDVLIDSTPRAQAAIEKSYEVQGWLRELLNGEPVESGVMWSKAKDKGFGERRVSEALKAVRAICELVGYQGKWQYRLPVSDAKDVHV